MPQRARFFSQSQAGFTLIEMVVTVGVMLLLVGGGVASFIGFNNRQKVIGAAKELENLIFLTQTKAQAGVVGACAQLEEYSMTFNTTVDPVEVDIVEVCAPGDPAVPVATTTTLTPGVLLSFNPAITAIRFKILAGGLLFTGGNTSIQAVLSDEANTADEYVLTISEGGDVSEGTWQ